MISNMESGGKTRHQQLLEQVTEIKADLQAHGADIEKIDRAEKLGIGAVNLFGIAENAARSASQEQI